MTAWRTAEKVLRAIWMDTRDKREEAWRTIFFYPPPRLLSMARESLSSGVRLIELSRSLFSLCREESTRFLTDVFFSLAQSTLSSPSPSPTLPLPRRLISIAAESCRQLHPRDSGRRLFLFFANQVWKGLFTGWNESVENAAALNGYDSSEALSRKRR